MIETNLCAYLMGNDLYREYTELTQCMPLYNEKWASINLDKRLS